MHSRSRQGISGFACTLAENVRIQLQFCFDDQRGFYVDAQKRDDRRIFIREGQNPDTKVGFDTGRFYYDKSIATVTERKATEGEKSIVEALLSGRIY